MYILPVVTLMFGVIAGMPPGFSGDLWTIRFFTESAEQVVLGPVAGLAGAFTVPDSGLPLEAGFGYEISVIVTDDDGFPTTDSVTIHPELVPVTLSTVPEQLVLLVDGSWASTPISAMGLVGADVEVNAPPQCRAGVMHSLDEWSDGGPAQHVVTIGESRVELEATFTAGGRPTGDANFDQMVDVDDLLAVILGWGPCPGGDACPADLDCSGVIDVDDLLQAILNWS